MEQTADASVYEVFRQLANQGAVEWVGSVRATDPLLAWHAAKEVYARRENCSALWVAPRLAFVRSEPDDAAILEGERFEYRLSTFPSSFRRARKKRQKEADNG